MVGVTEMAEPGLRSEATADSALERAAPARADAPCSSPPAPRPRDVWFRRARWRPGRSTRNPPPLWDQTIRAEGLVVTCIAKETCATLTLEASFPPHGIRVTPTCSIRDVTVRVRRRRRSREQTYRFHLNYRPSPPRPRIRTTSDPDGESKITRGPGPGDEHASPRPNQALLTPLFVGPRGDYGRCCRHHASSLAKPSSRVTFGA